MSDISIRTQGRAGRITLTRPHALNAMTYAMCTAIEDALDGWATDDDVALVIIDAEGDKAFCAGGDIADLYETGRAGDFAYGQRFWADEYRLNARIAEYPKPYVAFMQGFTMAAAWAFRVTARTASCVRAARLPCPNVASGLFRMWAAR